MEFTGKQSVQALEYASERELETRDFYQQCLDKASTPGVREILSDLVQDEQRHHDILMRLLTEVNHGEEPSPELVKTEAARVRVERAFSNLSIEDPNFQPDRQ
ncbi:MAG: ferritin family protein, partial [Candidatus Latescibacterota bacterium]